MASSKPLSKKVSFFLTGDSTFSASYFNLHTPASSTVKERKKAESQMPGIKTLVLILLMAPLCNCFSQSKMGFEQYSYLNGGNAVSFVPVIHFQANNGWYGECRYNYEDVTTLSFFGGRVIDGGKKLSYSITPMVGFSAGTFTGLSLATNAEAEWRGFYLSSQTQYSIATNRSSDNFFFSWSEIGYNVSDHLFGGVAFQYTLQKGVNELEPGFTAGLTFNAVSLPFYVFCPFSQSRSFVLGFNYEFNIKRKNKKVPG